MNKNHTLGIVHAIDVAFGTDSFTPTIIGVLLGGIHHRKINRLLAELDLQTESPRKVTDKGYQYVADNRGFYIKWNFEAVKLLSSTYSLPIDQQLINDDYRASFYYKYR